MSTSKKTIGFFGAGAMGRGIVRNLLKAGYPVTVFRHRDPLEDLAAAGARITAKRKEVIEPADLLLLCLPSSAEVEEVALGEDGILQHGRAGQVVIDHSTSHPDSTRRLAGLLQEKGMALLDAPLIYSRPEAEAGQLGLIVGGPKETLAQVRPVLEAFSSKIFYAGDVGHGHAIKLVNNLLALINGVAVIEGLALASRLGVSLDTLYEVVTLSGANSRMFETQVPRIRQHDPTVNFRLSHAHKDLAYASKVGEEVGMPVPLANSARLIYQMARDSGLGEENWTALVQFWETLTGVKVE